MSWATELLPWFQIGAAVATAIAAGAAASSARTSARTAKRADTTSKRAVEALSRATRPRLSVQLYALDDTSGPDAVRVHVDVVNEAPNRGVITAVRLERSDGFQRSTGTPVPTVIGANAVPYQPDSSRTFDMGEVRPSSPHGAPVSPMGAPVPAAPNADVVISAVVEFADASQLVTWRQVSRFYEQTAAAGREVPSAGPREIMPLWSFSLIDVSDPVPVTDLGKV